MSKEIAEGEETGLRQLVGLEVSAVCFVRDYVELHFDGPVLRAVSDPFGHCGCQGWRFPEGNSPILMRSYIGTTVDGFELIPDRFLALDFGEHRFVIPLDEASRSGPEAAHLQIPDPGGSSGRHHLWIW
ncbi:hypothetical protein [Catellatospora paridis]|uniref:hypothetical protein n=1 Tax=Catellatospora paridis TaxID=1617086 RepID=UPI0012D43C4E|nr:hypothetical protein [Catellatospora paridis]